MSDAASSETYLRFRVLPKLHQRVRDAAAAKGITVSEFARIALDQAVSAGETHHHYHAPEHALAMLGTEAGRQAIIGAIRDGIRRGAPNGAPA